MVQITTLATTTEGYETDDRLGGRPWPIAADSTGWAVLTPTENYRVTRAGRAITTATHASRITTSTGAGNLAGNQIRPMLTPYQVGLSRIAALLRLSVSSWPNANGGGLGGGVAQVSMTPRANMAADRTIGGSTSLLPNGAAFGFRLLLPTDNLYNTRAVSSAAEADNLWPQIEERYDQLYGLPSDGIPTGNNVSFEFVSDAAGGELRAPPWVAQHLPEPPNANTVGRHLKLTTTRIASEVANMGALLPVEIPSRSVNQCDILADPTQTDGGSAFAVLIDTGQAVVYYGSGLRTASSEAREIGRVPLPATRNSYATLENLYLAVNAQHIWVLAVNRRIVNGRPTLVYQRLDRATNQWLAEWAELIPPSTLTWAAGDFMPRTLGMTRVPNSDELAVAITQVTSAATNPTYLITDRAAGPRQPIIIRPGTENEVLNVAEPLEVAWQYNDPGGVAQGAYRLRRRVGSTDSYYAPGTGFTVTEDYIQWRQYDGVTQGSDAGTGSVTRAEAPSRIGSGSNTRNDDDNGTPTANNVLVVRVVKCRVKPGQSVNTVRWRSGDDGVDRILWCAIYPANTDGSPDFTASATGAAEERMTTTSTWTSSHRTVSPTLAAGVTFYCVSAGYVDDITTKSVDFQVSFNGGSTWYGNLATANDQRVQFLQWEWVDEYVTNSDWVSTATPATRVTQEAPNVSIPAPWAIAGGAAWELAVSTWNTDNDQSAESPPRRLLPGGASPPTISTPAEGAVIGALRIAATWTVGTQSRYALWLEDSGGIALTPRTPVESSTARAATVDAPRTGSYSLVLATWSSTGYRSEARVGVNIAHATALTAPTLSLSIPTVGATTTHRGYIVLSITGTFSTGYYWRAYRRIRGQADSELLLFAGRRVAVSDSHRDYTVASGTDYEYRAELVDPSGPAGPRTNTSAWVRST